MLSSRQSWSELHLRNHRIELTKLLTYLIWLKSSHIQNQPLHIRSIKSFIFGFCLINYDPKDSLKACISLRSFGQQWLHDDEKMFLVQHLVHSISRYILTKVTIQMPMPQLYHNQFLILTKLTVFYSHRFSLFVS